MYVTKIKKMNINLYKVHQNITNEFPQQKVMFYIDDNDIVVISESPSLNGNTSKAIKASDFKPGSVINFKTRLNPVKRNIITKKIETLPKDALPEFVNRRFTSDGFVLTECSATLEGKYIINKDNKNIPYESLRLEGKIEIKDSKVFIDTLHTGLMGKGKAFGFSMLNVF